MKLNSEGQDGDSAILLAPGVSLTQDSCLVFLLRMVEADAYDVITSVGIYTTQNWDLFNSVQLTQITAKDIQNDLWNLIKVITALFIAVDNLFSYSLVMITKKVILTINQLDLSPMLTLWIDQISYTNEMNVVSGHLCAHIG